MNEEQKKKAEEKLASRGMTLKNVTPEIAEALGNDYVDSYRKGHLVYTREFYQDTYKNIEKGMTYVESYKALGFDVDALGVNRANAAGKRAAKMAKNGELFKLSPGDFDGTVPLKTMKKKKGVTNEQMYAYLQARCMYLEAELKYEQEKKQKLSPAKNYALRNPDGNGSGED